MTADLNWNNFDKVSDLIENQADKATDTTKRKDANEALGQLLGVTDGKKSIFRDTMNDDQRNMFLSHVLEEYNSGRNTDTTQAVQVNLGLKPAPSISAPRGPSLGMTMAPPVPGGMGGGAPGVPQQAHNYYPASVQETPPWLLTPPPKDQK